jgi:hypothetical protein
MTLILGMALGIAGTLAAIGIPRLIRRIQDTFYT